MDRQHNINLVRIDTWIQSEINETEGEKFLEQSMCALFLMTTTGYNYG